MKKINIASIGALLLFFCFNLKAQTVTGELQRWHKVTVTFNGPNTSETANPNPFSDYRLEVTFTHSASNKSYTVPGYFAACGNAQNNSCNSGNKWRVNFAPDRTGNWNWSASFKKGSNVAINGGGSSGGFMDGTSGSINITESTKSGRDFRSKDLGRLQYVGEHYLRHRGTGGNNPNGPWFVKAGADSPENAFNYNDFDATPSFTNNLNKIGNKSWQPHQQDYNASDAGAYTWAGGKGTELLGVINYLASQGANAMSFLTWNTGGDDGAVFPHLLNVSISNYQGTPRNQQWGKMQKDRFDVSKMAQWEKIMEYADKKGVYLHFKTMETENDNLMDGNGFGRQRKLYYRELIARFGHHLALNWNLTEETTLTNAVTRQTINYIQQVDPYDHNVVIHTYPNQQDQRYNPLIGNGSNLTGASIQTDKSKVHADVKRWVEKSRASGRKWVVANDEQGNATEGVRVNDKRIRNQVLWGSLMAGGAGVEYYYGYTNTDGDINNQNHRLRGAKYAQGGHALNFFNNNLQPYLKDMTSTDGVTGDNNDYVLSKNGEVYAVYRPNGGSTGLNLPGGNTTYDVQWYNPRTGGNLTAKTTLGGNLSAPDNNDWVALILKKGTGGPQNDAPQTSLTSPAGGTSFAANATINLAATASDSDGTVSRVEFFINGNKVGEDTTAPYQATTTIATAGSYNVTSKATDNDGASTTSAAANITVTGGNPPPTGGDCVALETNGVAAVEAEHFASQEKDSKRKWYVLDATNTSGPTPDPDPSHANSSSGGGYLEILPDTRVTHGDPLIPGENFSNVPGQLTIVNYKVKFSSAGKYFVWVRAFSTGSEDNGVHVGLNGTWPVSGQRMQWCEGKNQWTWASKQRTAAQHCGVEQQIFLNIPSAGVHTISFSLREDGFEMDKFVLSKAYTKPSGNGPAEVLVDCGDTGNVAPQVALTAPTNGTSVNTGAAINLAATASDSDGTVAKVEFFSNGILVATDATAPYSASTTIATAGTYSITAKATDNEGSSTTSSARSITVTDGTPPPSGTIAIPGAFEAEAFQSKTGSIRIENTPGTSGKNLGFILNGDTTNYDVNVASTGNYSLDFYASSAGVGGKIEIFSGASKLGEVAVPINGQWHDYKKYTTDISLAQGAQSLKLLFTGAAGFLMNLDRTVTTLKNTPPPPTGGDTVTLDVIDDAYLQGTTGFNNTIVRVETGKRIGYLKYDLSSILGTITGAKLEFIVNGDSGNGNVNVNLGNGTNWSETNISAANRPAIGALLGSINEGLGIGAKKTIDLDVANISAGLLSLVVSQTTGNDFAFASKENGAVAGPKLIITTSALAPDPVAKTVGPIHDAFMQGTTAANQTIVRVEHNNRTGFLQYDLSDINGTITEATLEFTVVSDAGNGTVNVNLGTSSNWTETNLSMANKPGIGALLGNISDTFSIGNKKSVTLDATKISGNAVSLLLIQTSGNDFAFASKENGAVTSAKLILKYQPASATSRTEVPVVVNTEKRFAAFPIPSKNEVNISGLEKGDIVTIYDFFGNQKAILKAERAIGTLDISRLPVGHYFIQIKTSSGETERIHIVKN